MNKKILSLLFTVMPILTFAQEKGLDQKIDEVFGNATGWFVNFIFHSNKKPAWTDFCLRQ